MEAIVKSTPVYYEEYGTGIPILLLHGGGSDHHQMVSDMEPLFQDRSGWRRIYPDLPSFGKTPGADWITSVDHFLEILTLFMQTIAPDQHFVVGGVSWGASFARGLVYQQGAMIDGLLLIVPGVESDESNQQALPPEQVLVEDSRFQAEWPPEASWARSKVVVQSYDILEWFRTLMQPAGALVDYAFLGKIDEQFSFPIDQLPMPFPALILILTGRQDSLCGYNGAWRLLENHPRATFAVLDRAGHII
jgi:pimeloyl-ACP methyl ester carboxylesterase